MRRARRAWSRHAVQGVVAVAAMLGVAAAQAQLGSAMSPAGPAPVHTSANDGPGLGNLSYAPSELFTYVSVITPPATAPRQGPGTST
jgi:hypothetical protein